MLKKLIALLLALTMVLGVTACSSNSDSGNTTGDTAAEGATGENTTEESTTDGAAGEENGEPAFKMGLVIYNTSDEHMRTLAAATEWAVEAAGGELIVDSSALTAETTIAAVENLIQSGCDAITYCTYAGEATVPQVSKLCQENGVYWTMWDTTIADESIWEMIQSDPYFVGTTNEDQYQAGYDTMKAMAEAGAEHVVMIKYGVNIPTCDDRCSGGYDAAEELGVEILYEIVAPGTSSNDYKKAMQDALIAYPEADGAFLAGAGSNCPAISSAFEEAGVTDYVIGAFDYFDAMGDMLKDGTLKIINGGHMVTGTFAAAMAINAVLGTPLSEEKYSIVIPYLTLTSYEDYEAYMEYASEGVAYTAEELQQNCYPSYNPDVTLESFQEFVSQWSIADIIARQSA